MNDEPELPLEPEADAADAAGSGSAPNGHHLATVSHEGLFWDVYVEFDDDPRRTDSFGGLLCFSPAEEGDGLGPVRTATILIEQSYEEVLHRARQFENHHLLALLRSCLPEDGVAPVRESAVDEPGSGHGEESEESEARRDDEEPGLLI